MSDEGTGCRWCDKKIPLVIVGMHVTKYHQLSAGMYVLCTRVDGDDD